MRFNNNFILTEEEKIKLGEVHDIISSIAARMEDSDCSEVIVIGTVDDEKKLVVVSDEELDKFSDLLFALYFSGEGEFE